MFSICVQYSIVLNLHGGGGAPAEICPSWKVPLQECNHVGVGKRDSSAPCTNLFVGWLFFFFFAWSGGSFASAAVMKTFDFIFLQAFRK